MQAISTHVNMNTEKVRKKWVAHDGKKMLEVRADEFVIGSTNNWASVVYGKENCFANQIE